MGMRSFRAPPLPLPPDEYDPSYFNQLLNILSLYFKQLDSQNPLNIEGLILTNLTESPFGLPPFSLYREGRDVKILLPQDSPVFGVSSIVSIGSVTVNV